MRLYVLFPMIYQQKNIPGFPELTMNFAEQKIQGEENTLSFERGINYLLPAYNKEILKSSFFICSYVILNKNL